MRKEKQFLSWRSSLTPFLGEDGAHESKLRPNKTRHMLPNYYELR